MSFSISRRGNKEIRRLLGELARRGKLRDAADEINRRHARAMRRRSIPRDTGRLEASLTQVGHPDRIFRVSTSTIEIGTRVPYAIHQRGRIKRLNQTEIKEIWTKSVREVYARTIRRGGR